MCDSIWYLGSLGEAENRRRMMGASTALSVKGISMCASRTFDGPLTLTRHATPIYTRTYNHHIIDDGEAALASDVLASIILNLAVVEHGSSVHGNALFQVLLREREFVDRKKVPT